MKDTVGIYIRSAHKDQNNTNIEIQKEIIKKCILKKNEKCELIYYIDNGYSGLNFNRPAFKQLLEDIKQEKIRKIYIKDYSRLSRNMQQLYKFIKEYTSKYNVKFEAVDHEINLKEFLKIFEIIESEMKKRRK